jgi:hypothetical protein
MHKIILHICCAIIVIISAIDTYWLSKARDYIEEVEQNPVGRYLISLDNGDVSLFILCKFLGTYIAVAATYAIYKKYPKYGMVVAVSLAVAQICLLLYLYCVAVPKFWG